MFDDNKVSRNWALLFAFALTIIIGAILWSAYREEEQYNRLLSAGISPQAAYCLTNDFEDRDGKLRQACVGVQK